MADSLAILDYGSQYAQLIARRVREAHVYCELFPWDAPRQEVMAHHPRGLILSGGPASVYAEGAPSLPSYVLESRLPLLGICYGMQLLAVSLGGRVDPSAVREYGLAEVRVLTPDPLFPEQSFAAWMSHGDRITALPQGFTPLARSDNSPLAAMGCRERKYYGLQFHPEVKHSPSGKEILRRFAVEICGCAPDWTAGSIIRTSLEQIRQQVGTERALAAVSGGVDSAVAAALAQRAIGGQLVAIFVDTGLLRQSEPEQVVQAFQEELGVELVVVRAAQEFYSALKGVTDPERKRRVVGEKFIRLFEREAARLGAPKYLVQGTIYPDVVESSAPDRSKAAKIKSHHNVGGLPQQMRFQLVEPLRYLFKDEVRSVGEALGLGAALVWRQPFPGPGLAVRVLGEVTPERVERLRRADAIFTQELTLAGWLGKGTGASQGFAVLLPVHSVGVMGDERTYQETCALRAVTTEDFMTADWARLPQELLARTASRIVNEVQGINRVVYDITSKPPATIEWE
jgi:GMP synthase (glutamine-hydrolysing)